MSDHDLWQELGQQLRVDAVRASAKAGSGPSDLVDVRGRPRSGAARGALPLRLRRSEEPGERPPRLLEGPRVAPRLRPLPRRRRDLGRGVRHLPAVRLAAPGSSDAGAAVGRRRHRLARPGPADRRRHGARRQAARPAARPRLGALRRQRDGRGLDVGGDRARRVLRARQPDRDRRRQPARAARRDDARLGPLRRTPTGCRRSAGTRSRSTATTSPRSTRPTREAESTTGKPTAIVARTIKGKGVAAVEDKDGWHGKAIGRRRPSQELGGDPQHRRRRAEARGGRAAPLPAGARRAGRAYELGSEVATRKAYGDALAALGARTRGRGRARRRGLELDLRRDLRRRPSGAVLRDVHRRAADGRGGGRHAGRAAGSRSPPPSPPS